MDIRSISVNQIVLASALMLGLVLAVVVGNAVGSSDMRLVAGLIAIIPIAVLFVKLKTNIWILLPIGWFLTGRLPWLPLPFTVRDLCFATVILFFILFFATRVVPWKRKLSALDYLIYVNLAYLVTVYIRNPAGFWALQTSVVGGRPYFEIALAFGAFLVLSRVNISDFLAKCFPLFFVIPAWFIAILDLVARLLPQTALPLSSMYSGVSARGVTGAIQQEARIGETRFDGMQWSGWSSVLALCAKYNPITLISPFHPFRALLLGVALGAIFLSGFRSMMLFAMVTFLLSALLRGQGKDLWIAGAGMVLGLLALTSLQGSVLQLPLTVQRTLAWLPGEWSEEAKSLGEDSTRWRVEMWQWAWNDERILKDRTWGSGFGLSLDDMSLIAASLTAGDGGQNLLGGSDRESFLITGTFHSGPLSAVKYVGVVGLSLYYPLMCYMAWRAWRLCRRARGTRSLALALFVSIPIIYEPFNFVVVFGALDQNYPQLLFWAGLLNMTQRYVDGCCLSAKDVASQTAEKIRFHVQPVLARHEAV